MEEMPISKFKATCLAVLERVRRTRKPIRITRFGQPVAEVVPLSPPQNDGTWIGSLGKTGRIAGDLVEPISTGDEWEAGSI